VPLASFSFSGIERVLAQESTVNDLHRHVVVRPFRPEDQETAKGLVLDGLVEHWGWLDPTTNPDLDEISSAYAHGTFVVAWQGEEAVGTGGLLPEAEGVGRVVRMSVTPEKRRRGIGGLVLGRLMAQARANGYRQLVLETTSTWDDAIGFYESHGFRRVGSWDGDTHFVLDLL
jgi:GNAT superfamily N-acetyltransferase